jgi:enamine deaminase RidA (YjgF/YER057c/UK114 family)
VATQLTRTPGPAPWLPGSVTAGGLVFTSGLISPTAFAAGSAGAVPGDVQVAEVMDVLRRTLLDAGTMVEKTVRIEAFVSSQDLMDAWNAAFLACWPVPGPARTTVVVGFAGPGIDFELQAVAAL